MILSRLTRAEAHFSYLHLPLAFRSHSDKFFLPFFEKKKSWLLINCNRKSQTSLYRIMLLSSAKKNGKNMTILRKPPDQSSFILSSFKKREKRIYANHARFIQKKEKKRKKEKGICTFFFSFFQTSFMPAPCVPQRKGEEVEGEGEGQMEPGGSQSSTPLLQVSSPPGVPARRSRLR